MASKYIASACQFYLPVEGHVPGNQLSLWKPTQPTCPWKPTHNSGFQSRLH